MIAKEIKGINYNLFMQRISFSSIVGCWIWTGKTDGRGYGMFRGFKAHRVSYDFFNEGIDRLLVIDHMCKNKKCVNPIHLRQVEKKTNTLENSNAASALNKVKGCCKHGHEFTPENTFIKTDGNRGCRKCRLNIGRRNAMIRTAERFSLGLPSKLDMMKTHCKWGHEFTPGNTYHFKSGKRGCKECARIRRNKAKNKEVFNAA